MSLAADILSALNASAPVVALVDVRIFPSLMPQSNKTMPAIVYAIVSDVPESTLTSASSTLESVLSSARVQVDCYAKTYLAAHDLAAAVDIALGNLSANTPGLSSWRENLRDLYDNETQLHRVQLEFSIWH